MTEDTRHPDASDSAEPRMAAGERPGDYGVAPPDADGRYGADEGDPIDKLTAPLDHDDDVHQRLHDEYTALEHTAPENVALVNTEQPERLEQIRNRVRGEGHGR